MNFWRRGVGLECMFFMTRSLELRALPYALNPPPRAAASFNKSVQRMSAAGVGDASDVLGRSSLTSVVRLVCHR